MMRFNMETLLVYGLRYNIYSTYSTRPSEITHITPLSLIPELRADLLYSAPLSMNWVGKYSFGSIFYRGTSVCLTSEGGTIITIAPETEIYHGDPTRPLIPNVVFRNDTYGMRFEQPEGFYTRYKTLLYSDIHPLGGRQEFYDGGDSWNDLHKEDSLWCSIVQGTHKSIDLCSNSVAPGRVLYADNGTYIEILFLVYDYEKFAEELRRVFALAKINNVRFLWV